MPASHSMFRLKLPLDGNQLSVLQDWLQQLGREFRLSDRALFSLDLVLAEAITNIHSYSQPGDPAGDIEVTCALHADGIHVRLVDDGARFDPTTFAPRAAPASLADAIPGGLGIPLMRQYTTSMQYQRERDRNILCMTVAVD